MGYEKFMSWIHGFLYVRDSGKEGLFPEAMYIFMFERLWQQFSPSFTSPVPVGLKM